jgi:hypothetical protein
MHLGLLKIELRAKHMGLIFFKIFLKSERLSFKNKN